MQRKILIVSTAAVALLAGAPAQAKTCPSGQILRVSKGVCMDKSEASKLGIYRGGGKSVAKPAQTPDAPAAGDDAVEAKPKPAVKSKAVARAVPAEPKKKIKVAPEPEPTVAKPEAPKAVTDKAAKAIDAAKFPESMKPATPVRVIPMSGAAAAYAPQPSQPVAAPAPVEAPKALTPSPFGSLGFGAHGGASASAPAAGGGLGMGLGAGRR